MKRQRSYTFASGAQNSLM